MPSAEIITIGTELLLGEIQDTNTRYLALRLRDAGIDIFRATMVGDNKGRIAQVIQEALGRSDIVLTTGGLGPTVDDPTRHAVAQALGVGLEFHPELWEQILERFRRFNREATENNRRQAFIPQGATPIENPVGTAPAFMVEIDHKVIISLPGVPREMEFLTENKIIPYLKSHFHIEGTIKASVLHLAGVGESQVDEWIGDLETLANPTVGLLAHPGQIDIRVTAKASTQEQADQMIEELLVLIQQRVRDHAYGRDSETLEGVLSRKLSNLSWHMALIECGLSGEIHRRLKDLPNLIEPVIIKENSEEIWQLTENLRNLKTSYHAQVGLAVSYQPGPDTQVVTILVMTPYGTRQAVRSYGGPPQNGISYAVNTAIDFLRRCLPKSVD